MISSLLLLAAVFLGHLGTPLVCVQLSTDTSRSFSSAQLSRHSEDTQAERQSSKHKHRIKLTKSVLSSRFLANRLRISDRKR